MYVHIHLTSNVRQRTSEIIFSRFVYGDTHWCAKLCREQPRVCNLIERSFFAFFFFANGEAVTTSVSESLFFSFRFDTLPPPTLITEEMIRRLCILLLLLLGGPTRTFLSIFLFLSITNCECHCSFCFSFLCTWSKVWLYCFLQLNVSSKNGLIGNALGLSNSFFFFIYEKWSFAQCRFQVRWWFQKKPFFTLCSPHVSFLLFIAAGAHNSSVKNEKEITCER